MKFEFSNKHDFLLVCSESDFCPYCPKKIKCTEHHLLTKHWKWASLLTSGSEDKYIIPCHCLQLQSSSSRSHWHCPVCQILITRSLNFKGHMDKQYGYIVKENQTNEVKDIKKSNQLLQLIPASSERNEGISKTIKCSICSITFVCHSTLRRHQQNIHNIFSIPVYCVDCKNGICFMPRCKSGQRAPIHVQKTISKQQYNCEIAQCREFMAMASRSGHPALECKHLEMAKNAKPFQCPKELQESSLRQMLQKNLISITREKECKEIIASAAEAGVCAVFPVFLSEHGFSGRFVYFSVYTGKQDYWCLFLRTRVTFDTKSGQWQCQCKGSHKASICTHRYLSKWWLFQERPELLGKNVLEQEEANISNDDSFDNSMDSELEMSPAALVEVREYPPNKKHMRKMVEYIHSHKRIPEYIPETLTMEDPKIPPKFIPIETHCPYCPGPTPPSLLEPKLITKNATVCGMYRIHKGIYVYVKICPICATPVRYQEYSSGFHNFNDRIFLTIPLCILMTSSFQITIKLLQKIEGRNRYEAELVLMRGYFLPSDEDELDEVQTVKKVKRDALK